MSLFNVFDVSGSALSAQSVRLNTVASNLANADNVATTPEEVYKPRQPVFSAILDSMNPNQAAKGVRVDGVVESQADPLMKYDPGNPLANEQGYVYSPDISTVEEMSNMISASRSYQNNVEVMTTSKQLLMRTLQLGQ
ncbi:flagellar basal body rod protein FlgC [Solemya pervernicosa gill symbiont]|uniref:Flagellar basal-body rod protein FlgC n=2 Tax=Gammaproteobacteria incertae sedis TaxID=118884 RepID=A0A1T2L8R4_9GAMM|nr:flagellar basal body rod protein FlgC [Solemya pervernicosa gill symbiont]